VPAYHPDVQKMPKFIHAGGAIAWVGAGAFVQVLVTRVASQNRPPKMASFARDIEALGTTYYAGASMVVLMAGLALVICAPFVFFSETWIIFGLVGYAAPLVTGPDSSGPSPAGSAS
jgi:uncharacterized membrane protein